MFSWTSILAAFLKIAGAVADYLKTRQLLDAGRAVQRDKDRSETDRRVDAGRAAANDPSLPRDDEFRTRDN
jgi:hypothetical protein